MSADPLQPSTHAPRRRRRGRLPVAWLLFALVLMAWYPLRAGWQSDDYIALHYTAGNLGNALSDFVGNQYGLPGVTWFYRPFITLSFWIEQSLFGADAFVSHLTNAVAHAISACLIGAISARFCGSLKGFLVGLVWGMAPIHTGSVMWAVGRVDSHTTVWVLWSCLLALRYFDRRRRKWWPALLVAAIALGSKESALVLPALVTLLVFADAPRQRRLRRALATYPFYLLLGLYFVVRRLALGRWLGGYVAAGDQPPWDDPSGLALGLASKFYHCIDPLPLTAGRDLPDPLTFSIPAAWAPAGVLPFALAIGYLVWRRRWIGLWVAPALFVVGALPMIHSWTAADIPQNLRLFYLPFASLAFVIGAAGPVVSVLALLTFLVPTVQLHHDYFDVFTETRSTHRQLIDARRNYASETVLVAGLPRAGGHGNAVAFQLGVDRLLQAPFVASGDARRTVLALRPLDARPDAHRFSDTGGAPPLDLPTLLVTDSGKQLLGPLPRAEVPAAPLRWDGPEILDRAALEAMHRRESQPTLHFPDLRGVDRADIAHCRVTIFTAGGYLRCYVTGRPDPGGGLRVTLRDVLEAEYARDTAARPAYVLLGLEVPLALDLRPRFPVLVEALDADGRALLANAEPVWLHFDPAVCRWIRGEAR